MHHEAGASSRRLILLGNNQKPSESLSHSRCMSDENYGLHTVACTTACADSFMIEKVHTDAMHTVEQLEIIFPSTFRAQNADIMASGPGIFYSRSCVLTSFQSVGARGLEHGPFEPSLSKHFSRTQTKIIHTFVSNGNQFVYSDLLMGI